MSFKEIIGQENAVALLKKAWLAKRVSHAYIFVGPDGVGKKKAAMDFAKLLVCVSPAGQEPCDACASCRKVATFNHPDVQWVGPEGQYIKIDAIREACRRLSLRGFESQTKVLIITEAQCLNDESSNALLKTLEEPTPQTVIILLADTLKSILPTISSRCQKIAFSLLEERVLLEVLEKEFGAGKQEVVYLARMAEGRLGLALKFHEDGLFERKNKIIQDALSRTCPLDTFIELASGDRSQKSVRIDEALSVLSSWFRDLLVAKVSAARRDFINVDRIDDIMTASRRFSFSDIETRIGAIAEAAAEKDRNINMRILLTNLRVELWK